MGEEQNKSAFENEQDISQKENVSVEEEVSTDGEVSGVNNNDDEGNFENSASDNNNGFKEQSFQQGSSFSKSDAESSGLQQAGSLEDEQSQYKSQYSSQYVNVEAQDSTPVKTKKKSILYPSTIVVLVLVVASIVIYAVYASFQPSIKGAWVSTSVDETSTANSYLVLGDDNVAYMTLGTMRYMGVYSTSFDEDGQKILTVDIPYALQSNFVYELQGDIMTLVMEGDTTEYTFKNVELPDYTLTVPDDYVRDDNLLGKWKDYTYDIEYTFRADGTMLISEAGVVEADCIYNIVDGTIHVEYLAGEVYSMDMEYTVDGNNLTIGVMNFQKIADENGNVIQTEEQTTEADTTAETTVEETVAA